MLLISDDQSKQRILPSSHLCTSGWPSRSNSDRTETKNEKQSTQSPGVIAAIDTDASGSILVPLAITQRCDVWCFGCLSRMLWFRTRRMNSFVQMCIEQMNARNCNEIYVEWLLFVLFILRSTRDRLLRTCTIQYLASIFFLFFLPHKSWSVQLARVCVWVSRLKRSTNSTLLRFNTRFFCIAHCNKEITSTKRVNYRKRVVHAMATGGDRRHKTPIWFVIVKTKPISIC